jgi:hypothetical protein
MVFFTRGGVFYQVYGVIDMVLYQQRIPNTVTRTQQNVTRSTSLAALQWQHFSGSTSVAADFYVSITSKEGQ